MLCTTVQHLTDTLRQKEHGDRKKRGTCVSKTLQVHTNVPVRSVGKERTPRIVRASLVSKEVDPQHLPEIDTQIRAAQPKYASLQMKEEG